MTKTIINGSDFGSWGVGFDVKINILEETEKSVTGSQIYEEEEEEELEEEKNDYFEDNFSKITKEVVLYEFDLEVKFIFKDLDFREVYVLNYLIKLFYLFLKFKIL